MLNPSRAPIKLYAKLNKKIADSKMTKMEIAEKLDRQYDTTIKQLRKIENKEPIQLL